MKNFLLTGLLFTLLISAQAQTLAERLGYPADAKLLIIHADDLAVAHAENEASFQAMRQGMVTSASVMAPCPWLPEVAAYARAHSQHDLGMHLTLTSEWLPYRWGPVAPRGEVPSLVDSNGYFYSNCEAFARKARAREVEIELRAQIERAKALGLDPTHLDSHMGCLFWTNPEFFGIYLRMGREYRIPVMVGRNFLKTVPDSVRQMVTEKDIVVDQMLTASPENYQGGMANYYTDLFKNLPAGVHVLVMHTAFANEESTAMTAGFPGMWDAGWRQADYDFFTSEQCREVLKSAGIQLITWREIGGLLR